MQNISRIVNFKASGLASIKGPLDGLNRFGFRYGFGQIIANPVSQRLEGLDGPQKKGSTVFDPRFIIYQ